MIGGFGSVLCVSAFQGSLVVIAIMIDGSENAIVRAVFEFQSSRVCDKRSKAVFVHYRAGKKKVGGGGRGEMLPSNAFTSYVSTALSFVSIAYFQFRKFGHTQIKGKFRLLPFGFSLPCFF